MRYLVAPLAALALTACFGAPGEPLRGNEQPAPAAPTPADDADKLTPEQQLRLDMIAEIALAMGQAADVANDAASAGLARNQAGATLAASQAAQVADTVRQRAGEVVSALADTSSSSGCGSTNSAPSDGSGVSDDDISDAVAAAMCAADAAQAVAEALVPSDPTTTCVCGACTETPGEIDEAGLATAIDSVTAAAEACGDSEDVLTDGNNTSG
jgi:hypothetical protein